MSSDGMRGGSHRQLFPTHRCPVHIYHGNYISTNIITAFNMTTVDWSTPILVLFQSVAFRIFLSCHVCSLITWLVYKHSFPIIRIRSNGISWPLIFLQGSHIHYFVSNKERPIPAYLKEDSKHTLDKVALIQAHSAEEKKFVF